MALRLVEVLVPRDRSDLVRKRVAKEEVLDVWEHDVVGDRSAVRILVETDKTEPLLDTLETSLVGSGELRIVLLPVEATRPRPEPRAVAPDQVVSKRVVGRVSRDELLSDLSGGVQASPQFFVFVVLSTVVAAVGLVRDEVAIVIGAMVIAPLLVPNVALALATALGDRELWRKALLTNARGVAVAFGLSAALGLGLSLVGDFEPGREILARTKSSFGDVVLALAAGSAGALAFTTGVSAGLVGVMVAVALLPPLVVMGLMVGSGEFGAAAGALLLLSTNVICVNLTGVLTFLVQGIQPRTWWEADKAKRAARRALVWWGVLLALLIALIVVARL